MMSTLIPATGPSSWKKRSSPIPIACVVIVPNVLKYKITSISQTQRLQNSYLSVCVIVRRSVRTSLARTNQSQARGFLSLNIRCRDLIRDLSRVLQVSSSEIAFQKVEFHIHIIIDP